MRRSFVMLPALSRGTLKSTRISTFLPFRSDSWNKVFFDIRRLPQSKEAHGPAARGLERCVWELGKFPHARDDVGGAVAVAPFVVVPAEDLDHRPLALGHDQRAL